MDFDAAAAGAHIAGRVLDLVRDTRRGLDLFFRRPVIAPAIEQTHFGGVSCCPAGYLAGGLVGSISGAACLPPPASVATASGPASLFRASLGASGAPSTGRPASR